MSRNHRKEVPYANPILTPISPQPVSLYIYKI